MAKPSKAKVIISGNVIEFYEYEKPVFLEGNSSGGRRKRGEGESEKAEEYRKQNNRRSRAEFRRKVLSNFTNGDKFLTLTFKDTDKFDIRNVEDTNKQFKKFIQRIKYKFGDFKYIAVIEFQDKYKRGAVHYHLICDLPYIEHSKIAEIWGLGFIGINAIKGVDNIGAYLGKYMAKDLGDERLKGKKNWFASKGLTKPIEVTGYKAERLLEEYKQKKEVFTNSYASEHFGNIVYREYNLKRV